MTDRDDLDAYIIHVAELQAEIADNERLREQLWAVLGHVVELRAEIERLKAAARHRDAGQLPRNRGRRTPTADPFNQLGVVPSS